MHTHGIYLFIYKHKGFVIIVYFLINLEGIYALHLILNQETGLHFFESGI